MQNCGYGDDSDDANINSDDILGPIIKEFSIKEDVNLQKLAPIDPAPASN